MRDLTNDINKVLSNGKELDRFGHLLHENWMLKRELVGGITNPNIDSHYESALKAGALGGKLLGAGGGGFLLFYARKRDQDKVRKTFKGLMEIKVNFEPQGSKIIYVGG